MREIDSRSRERTLNIHMENNLLISVVVPVYNLEKCLPGFIRTLTNQTYRKLEILLVDDGSTDSSGFICDKAASCDARIRAIHLANSGSGPARNAGIEAASGDFVFFPDPDDDLDVNAICVMVNSINGGDDLLVFGYNIINKKGKTIFTKKYENSSVFAGDARKNYAPYFGMGGRFAIQGAPWNKLFSLSLIKKHGIRYPALRRHQDDAFISMYMCFSSQIRFIDAVLYSYRTNDLRLEWDKFPIDYVQNVIDFYEIRKNTILKWNPNDSVIKKCVINEYVSKSIKALELSFSPKMKLSRKTRKEWLGNSISKLRLDEIRVDDNPEVGRYHKIVMRTISKKSIGRLYCLLRLKVFFEKSGLITIIKRGKV